MEEKEFNTVNKKQAQPNNVVHGIKLKDMLTYLIEYLGWEEMGKRVDINCFNSNPSIRSSLNFLRKTPWAKEKVQRLYIDAVKGQLKPVKDRTKKKWPFLPK
jgi:uncharacterized protein (DUF2132 family)